MPEEVKRAVQTERRRCQRIRKDFRVRLKKFSFPLPGGEEHWHQGVITNISACGILILLQPDFFLEELRVGDMLHMELELGRWDHIKATDKPFDYYYQREPFSVLGRVIRFEKDDPKRLRAGVDFIGVDEGQRTAVFRFIQKQMSR